MRFRTFFETTNDDWWNEFIKIAKYSPFSHDLYDILTKRDSESNLKQQYQQYGLQNKEKEYDSLLRNLSNELNQGGYSILNSSSWFHVIIPYKNKYKSNYEQAPVDAFKTYRTFTPSKEVRITKFLEILPGFAEELKELQNADPNYPDRIQFKIPSQLKIFFEHPDTLVVHWRNKFNRDRINHLIDSYFNGNGIKFTERGIRATQGYDMNSSDKNFTGGSHTELLSVALEKLIKKTPQLRNLPNEQIKEFLQKSIKNLNNLSPKDIYHYIVT